MRAILIDAVERQVREVEWDGGLEAAYKLLRCELVDVVGLGAGHDMYVDDEGLLKENGDDDPFFVLANGWTFAGSGLVIGWCGEDGFETAATLPVEAVRERVAFASRKQLRSIGAEPKPGMKIFSFGDS